MIWLLQLYKNKQECMNENHNKLSVDCYVKLLTGILGRVNDFRIILGIRYD